MIALLLLGCADPCASPYTAGDTETVTSGGQTFTRQVIDAGVCGPAFAAVADLEGDGSLSLIVTWFGQQDGPSVPNGGINRYPVASDLAVGAPSPLLSPEDGVKWPNAPHVLDLDGDADQDIVVGVGFLTCLIDPWTAPCGGLIGFENDGGRLRRFDVVTPGADLFYHAAVGDDVDGDGVLDLVTVGESIATPYGHQDRAEAQWFRGQGGGFESSPRVMGEGLGSLPSPFDVDGDGDTDWVGAEYFRADAASFAWLEQVTAPTEAAPAGGWVRHVIDDASGGSIQLTPVEGLFEPGEAVFVGTNHVNNAPDADEPGDPKVLAYTIPHDPTDAWVKTVLASDFAVTDPGAGVGAPGIFGAGDIDGDGDIDLLVSGDGDPAVYWLEQTATRVFEQHVLEPSLSQGGSMLVVDLNGDGANELVVSGYDDNVLFLYERERT